MRVLVAGATGYVGARLVAGLVDAGHGVRCLTRDPRKLEAVPWAGLVEVVRGDALEQESLDEAMREVDAVYYLVHSLGTGPDFEEVDRRAADNVARAAAKAGARAAPQSGGAGARAAPQSGGDGVQRIIYLGGLVPEGEEPSPHLRSRAEVGQIFLDSPVPAIVLQAGVIIGSGSASFEMLRYLTERLPAMVTPKWVGSRVQPIAVGDVIDYLLAALDLPEELNRRFDIAGPDVVSYREMMQRYAQLAGLWPRLIVGVPVLSPWLSSQWINLVTPVPKAIAQPLIESLRNSAVAREHDIQDLVTLEPASFDAAVLGALADMREGAADGAAVGSATAQPGAALATDPSWSGGTVYVDERSTEVDAAPDVLWRVIEGIGGERGWYSSPAAWAARGMIDRLVGGVGLHRGRLDPDRLEPGVILDFWRVDAIERGRLLRLRAEMRLPGEAWLEFTVEPAPIPRSGGPLGPWGSRLTQRATFIPHGLPGILYWSGVTPFHNAVFGSMLRNVAATAAATS